MRPVHLVALALPVACGGQAQSGSASPAGSADGGARGPDGGAVQARAERSGTRIQIVDWFSGDVPVARKELRDTKHDVPCVAARAEDGTFRCLPVSQGGTVHFLDDRCKVPVISVSASPEPGCHETPSPYVTHPAPVSCPEPRTFVALRGEAIDTPTTLYDSRGYENCLPAVPPAEPFYAAIPSPPGDWAPLTREVLEETPGLGIEVFYGEDGSRALGTLRILPEDAECVPHSDDGLKPPPYGRALPAHCAPARPAELGPWTTTPSCNTDQGAVIGSPRCDPQPFARDFRRGFVRAGPPVETDVWLYLLGACGNVTELPDTVFHLPGETLPITSFQRLDLVRVAAGPVERLGWTAREGGAFLPDVEINVHPSALLPGASRGIGWSDPAAGENGLCLPRLFEEGTVLCVPPDTGFEAWGPAASMTVFSDPSCGADSAIDVFATERNGVFPVPQEGQWIVKNPPTLPGSIGLFAACMSDGVEVRRATGRHEGPAYVRFGPTCSAIDPNEWLVVDLGPPVPAKDVLPALTARAL
ncbi:MAG: hypothetical protein FJ104_08510 [Deltaproteobacteria bacterium]|nr:hypothetical protein [Deltaproteobacteria bacterium]